MLGFLGDIVDFLIPPACHVCGASLLKGERFLCPSCIAALPRTHYYSGYAGTQAPSAMNPMEHRFAGKFPFGHAVGYFFYAPDSRMASLIHDFKYRNFPSLARRLGDIIGTELFLTGFFSDVDFLMPVPIHWSKRLKRGYNQTEMLARGVSDASKVAVSTDLRAIKAHRTQTHLTPLERAANTRGIFRLSHPERYAGKHIVIMDDVCTTGSTLTACAESILRDAPTARISILTLAVTF